MILPNSFEDDPEIMMYPVVRKVVPNEDSSFIGVRMTFPKWEGDDYSSPFSLTGINEQALVV